MSLDQGFRYETSFGYHPHNSFLPTETFTRPFDGNYMDNSLNKLYNQVESHEQGFPSTDLPSQPFGDSLLGHLAGKSLLESFGQFNLEPGKEAGYNGWPTPAAPVAPAVDSQELGTKSPMKFPSQVLTQNARASPFSDTTESSLFSNSSCSNFGSSRLDLQPSQFSNFGSSSCLLAPASHTNSFGLSDLSSRLEHELSQGPMMMSQGPSTRDSTPLSWNPMTMNYSSSKTSSLTSSPTMSQSKNFPKPTFYAKPEPEDNLLSEDEEEKLAKLLKVSQASHQMLPPSMTMPLATSSKPKLLKSMSTSCVPEPGSAGTSWSQIVRTSSSKLPSLHQSVSPVSSGPVTRASLTPSPPTDNSAADKEEEPQLVVEEVPPTTNTVDFHRGPKVDPRWPVAQQVFLGPIPMSITWDEIRNVFYTKVQRRELLHFYVQSKPVNEVVYGQVVFDKIALANKVVKDGPVKVRGHLINVTLMKEKVKAEKRK